MIKKEKKNEIINQLEEDMISGRYIPRGRLTERELMERFNINRYFARLILDELEARGFVVKKVNYGAQVRTLTSLEVKELYFMRTLLHKTAAKITVLPLLRKDIKELKRLQAKHDIAIRRGNFRAAFRADEKFHDFIDAACENNLLVKALKIYKERTNPIRSVVFRDLEALHHSSSEHHLIIKALNDNDKELFVDRILNHILGSKDLYISMQSA